MVGRQTGGLSGLVSLALVVVASRWYGQALPGPLLKSEGAPASYNLTTQPRRCISVYPARAARATTEG